MLLMALRVTSSGAADAFFFPTAPGLVNEPEVNQKPATISKSTGIEIRMIVRRLCDEPRLRSLAKSLCAVGCEIPLG